MLFVHVLPFLMLFVHVLSFSFSPSFFPFFLLSFSIQIFPFLLLILSFYLSPPFFPFFLYLFFPSSSIPHSSLIFFPYSPTLPSLCPPPSSPTSRSVFLSANVCGGINLLMVYFAQGYEKCVLKANSQFIPWKKFWSQNWLL